TGEAARAAVGAFLTARPPAPAAATLPTWIARADALLRDACDGRTDGLAAGFDALATELDAADQLLVPAFRPAPPPAPALPSSATPNSATLDDALKLAVDLHQNGALHEAGVIHRRILVHTPSQPDTLHLLGLLAHQAGRHRAAARLVDRAIRVRGTAATYHSTRGIILQALGRFAEADRSLRQALALRPGFTEAHSNLILGLDYMPDADTAAIQAECRRWYDAHGRPHAADAPPARPAATAGRRLRVGYVSSDFRQHPTADVLLPLLYRHDRAAVEVVCYSGTTARDAVTERFQTLADHWCDTTRLSDAELAERVRADGVDILVNVAGHAHGGRLGVFVRRPAPVQVSAWGLPRGTGLPQMDALFLDPVMAPAGERGLYAETVVDLPCWLTYTAPDDTPPVVPPPRRRAGHVTLGAASRLEKLSDGTVAVWSEILHSLPAARLLLKSWHLGEAGNARDTLARFAAHGIPADRLDLIGGTDSRAAHMAVYDRIDLALDPFPHGGGITTCDSLWMGVPVITVLGHAPAGRGSASILHAVGLDDCVAGDLRDYVARAIARAADADWLDARRSSLRERFRRSAVGDVGAYARAVEDAYRRLREGATASRRS
ncbi:MAG TPA: hypothetical protein VGE72_23715, partial [Azospirillum sp.]